MAIFRDNEGIFVEIPDEWDEKTGKNKAYEKAASVDIPMDNEVISMMTPKGERLVKKSRAIEKMNSGEYEPMQVYEAKQTAKEDFKNYYKPEDFNKKESFGVGGLSGASMGFAPAVGGIGHALTNKQKNETFRDAYRRGRDSYKNYEKAAAEANPWSYGAGQISGGVGTGVATAGAPIIGAAGGGLKGLVKSGAAMGAISGAGQSDVDLTQDNADYRKFAGDIGSGALAGGLTGGAFHAVGQGAKQAFKMGKEITKRLTPKAGEAFNIARKEGVNPAANENFLKNVEDTNFMGQRFHEAGTELRQAEGTRLGEALKPEVSGTFNKPVNMTNIPKTDQELALEQFIKDKKLSGTAKEAVMNKINRMKENTPIPAEGTGPLITSYKELSDAEGAMAKLLARGGDTEYVGGLSKALDDIKGLKTSLENGEGSLNDVQEVKRRLSDMMKNKMESGNLKDAKVRGILKKTRDTLDKTLKETNQEYEEAAKNYAKISKWLNPEEGAFPKTAAFKHEARSKIGGKDINPEVAENLSNFRGGLEDIVSTAEKQNLPLPSQEALSKLKGLQQTEPSKLERYAVGMESQGLKGIPAYLAGEGGVVTGNIEKEIKKILGKVDKSVIEPLQTTKIGNKIVNFAKQSPDFMRQYFPLFLKSLKRNGSKGMIALDGYLAKNDPNYEDYQNQNLPAPGW